MSFAYLVKAFSRYRKFLIIYNILKPLWTADLHLQPGHEISAKINQVEKYSRRMYNAMWLHLRYMLENMHIRYMLEIMHTYKICARKLAYQI